MQLLVVREPSNNDTTLGKLYIEGVFFCDTLEDVIREQEGIDVSKWKEYGRTAIPQGSYEITAEDSPKFGPDTLTVNGVHGFDKIRIHAGNTNEDTHGCLLVGRKVNEHAIGQSRLTLADLKAKILPALKENIVVILTYQNP